MILNVPFIYTAEIIKPRCRKSVLVAVLDYVEIEFREFCSSDLPVAFRVGSKEIHFDGDNLWEHCKFNKEKLRNATLEEVVKNTNIPPGCEGNLSYKFSCPSGAAPFHNFWHYYNAAPVQRSAWIKDNIPKKENIDYREWVSDNRGEVVSRAFDIAKEYCAMDGLIMSICSEPRYVTMSFGCGANYSTAMFITQDYNTNISNRCYFNANELPKATEMLIEMSNVAISDPKTNCGNTIEVLIPEAVRCNPKADHPA